MTSGDSKAESGSSVAVSPSSPSDRSKVTGTGHKLPIANELRSKADSPVRGKPRDQSPSKQSDVRVPFRYRAKSHRELPHVVKFSGGRSSGMLLFTLLENDVLDAQRGDVVLFNNTSAEHPKTYEFVRECTERAESAGIPFFWVEYQTYEDARNGEWTRLPSYRLVDRHPWSQENTSGFHWRGEVFEELVSWSGYLPNQFKRICTGALKLETTRAFMTDWLAGNVQIPRLGHHDKVSRLDPDALHRRHERNRGGVPKEIFLKKRSFAMGRPHVRPKQRYADFSRAWVPFDNRSLTGNTYGGQAWFGKGGAEYVAFVGLRGDEEARVERVRARNGPGQPGHAGEHVYMPLADMSVSRAEVNEFWEAREWRLGLPGEGALSNCVFCFLKGGAILRAVHTQMQPQQDADVPGFGPLADSPCDAKWWARIEREYGRDLKAENRRQEEGPAHIGFGGLGGMVFGDLDAQTDAPGADQLFENAGLPCDCTE